VPAEWTRRIELVVRVRPDHAGAQLADHLENLAPLVGPNAGAQSVRSIVGAFDRLLRCAECHHAEYRPEDLFLRHAMARSNSRDQARRKPITALGQRTPRLHQLSAFIDSRLHQTANLLELRPRVDRSDIRIL